MVDPEMPMLTLADLGVLRDVREEDGRWWSWITPTYSGCPAMATMRDDLVHAAARTPGTPRRGAGRAAARRGAATASPSTAATRWPGTACPPPDRPPAARGPSPLTLLPRAAARSPAPAAAASEAELTSEFGSTACKALYRCTTCLEPFDHVKEI